MKTVCNECGRSVAPGSGNFVNRVPDLNAVETRLEMGKAFPERDFICSECDARMEKMSFDAFKLERVDEARERCCEACEDTWDGGGDSAPEVGCAYEGNEEDCRIVMCVLEDMYERYVEGEEV